MLYLRVQIHGVILGMGCTQGTLSPRSLGEMPFIWVKRNLRTFKPETLFPSVERTYHTTFIAAGKHSPDRSYGTVHAFNTFNFLMSSAPIPLFTHGGRFYH